MDFSKAATKIADISLKINAFIDKIKAIYNKYAGIINGYIDEFEKVISNLNKQGAAGIVWVEMKIQVIFKKISDAVNALLAKINNITKQIKTWYNNTIKRVKIDVIKATFIKINQPCSDSMAEAMADSIPHPDVESLIPKIEINMPIPPVSENIDYLKNIELKKIPLL